MIKHLKTKEELLQGYEVLKELRTHLTEETFFAMYEKMKREGYEIHACYDSEEVMAVTGIIPLTNYYDGYHIYVYDLVTASHARSNGYGEKLLSHIEMLAKEKGCQNVTLSSGIQRKDAHRFYEEKMQYDKTSFVFKKEL
ncbi:GNAT superfamily N-acetyltransferase [Bacillus tianshenii]|uniref:GNAT superfamily N-acetyltransferase n=1 Tax=Sutcliffiella tianshenii TaxID=1463404 RepID=A0ABS2P1S7_9BACI|nr:GNAT family N-acetyltransferase [Bacillus tianshenii]MBM7620911.1 GNAT superfamily N-acetyltransferase [Bacillus tianshenii]